MLSAKRPGARLSLLLLCAAGHLLGVVLFAAVLAATVLSPDGLVQLASQLSGDVTLLDESAFQIGVHFTLSAVGWAAVVLGSRHVRGWFGPRGSRPWRLESTRGSVLTETLIVLPLVLMFVFGLAQLAVNNIAGTLANVAVYQATRSAWVWQPEVGHARVDASVSSADVEERARIAAALVMTPVAPAGFIEPGLVDPGDSHFGRIHRAMFESNFDHPDAAPSNAIGTVDYSHTFSAALDRSDFDRRSARKFAHAYLSVDRMQVRREGDHLRVDMRYLHFQAFPMVRALLGEQFDGGPGYLGGADEYYTPIERSMRMPAQMFPPNTRHP